MEAATPPSPKPADDRRTARLFRNGRNQAVRLPRDFELDSREVYIQRDGERIILTPKPVDWEDYFTAAHRLSPDFPECLEDPPPEDREPL